MIGYLNDIHLLDLSRPLRDQVDMDSMDFFNLLLQVHKRPGVYVPNPALQELNNMEALIDYIPAQA